MPKYQIIFRRDLASDAEVIGAKNPTDRQLFEQMHREFKGTVLAPIDFTKVIKGDQQYHVHGTVEYGGSPEELTADIQTGIYDKDFSVGQFTVGATDLDASPKMGR